MRIERPAQKGWLLLFFGATSSPARRSLFLKTQAGISLGALNIEDCGWKIEDLEANLE